MKKLPAKFWAISNGGGWGEGQTIAEAVKRCLPGCWATKGRLAPSLEFNVWALDPAKPVTHISDENGHALHRAKDAKPTAMGRYDDDYSYVRDGEGKIVKPKYFQYEKGATSEAGKNIAEIQR